MSLSPELLHWMHPRLQQVEEALASWIDERAPAQLGQAMRYAVLDGGKRLRPLLVMATAQALGGDPSADAVLRSACALELIHAYSLVHDDMPCMDNDVLRRGKPTVHVQFGQAQALLAGDALQSFAFELLTPDAGDAVVQARCCGLLARASGYWGMAGGQAIDLANVGQRMSLDELQLMHRLKTGALLLCGVQMGAVCAGVQESQEGPVWQALERFGQTLGLAFQVVDDVLDVTADSATLGKTAGKDAEADKPTYVSLLGLAQAQTWADELAAQAEQALSDTGLNEDALTTLRALTRWVVQRTH